MTFRPPFTDASSQIRLLHVHPGSDSEGPIVCDMETFDLHTAPKYGAISYAWGDPAKPWTVTINSSTVAVGENAYNALQQVRRQLQDWDEPGYCWMDALCIDQENLEEKGVQVANMGGVYQCAAVVFACVGMHADRSEALMDLIRAMGLDLKEARREKFSWIEKLIDGLDQFCHYLDQHRQAKKVLPVAKMDNKPPCDVGISSKDSESSYEYGVSRMNGETLTPPHSPTPPSIPHDVLFTLVDTLVCFVNRPYWFRAWVQQEIRLGHSVNVLCGESVASMHALSTLLQIVETCVEMGADCVFDHPSVKELWPRMVNSPVMYTTYSIPMKLTHALPLSNKCLCNEPKDYIYSLLSLVSNGEHRAFEPPLRPDYSISTLALTLSVLERVTNAQWNKESLTLTALHLINRFSLTLHIKTLASSKLYREQHHRLRLQSSLDCHIDLDRNIALEHLKSSSTRANWGSVPKKESSPRLLWHSRRKSGHLGAQLIVNSEGHLALQTMTSYQRNSVGWDRSVVQRYVERCAQGHSDTFPVRGLPYPWWGPQGLYFESTVIGVVPYATQPRDWFIATDWAVGGGWALVVREHRGDVFEIIGPAYRSLSGHSTDWFEMNEAQASQVRRFEVAMDSLDLLTFVTCGRWGDWRTSEAMGVDSFLVDWSRMTPRHRFSSFAIGVSTFGFGHSAGEDEERTRKQTQWLVPHDYLTASAVDIQTGAVFAKRLYHRERKHPRLRRVASVI